MNKAFIFDMDGVLVDSERFWSEIEKPFLRKILGDKVSEEIGIPIGLGLEGIYQKATALGAQIDKAEYLSGYEDVAMRVYDVSPITEGLDALAGALVRLGFKIGIVTQSPQRWIDRVFPKISFKDQIEVVVSLAEHPDLKPKPDPDGYIEAFRVLGADPKTSVVLEDSNPGIRSGKASGAYTIGFCGNLVGSYEQTGADAYADTMGDVIRLVESLDGN